MYKYLEEREDLLHGPHLLVGDAHVLETCAQTTAL